jgi:hypothetical protein
MPDVPNIYGTRGAISTEALNDPGGGREAAEAIRSLTSSLKLGPDTMQVAEQSDDERGAETDFSSRA